MKRRALSFAALASCVLGSISGAALAQDAIRANYRFTINPDACAAGDTVTGRCRPWSKELGTTRRELHPVVPVRVARLLLPLGERLTSVRFSPGAIRSMDFNPEIARRQLPISLAYDPRPQIKAYAGGAYPADWLGEARVSESRG